MRKINSKFFIILLLSVCMLNSVSVLTVNSLNNMETYDALDTIPNSAEDANINAWIIVAGDRDSDHSLYTTIENGCEEVYDILLGLGYPANNLYYMAADWDGSLPVKASNTSDITSIAYAIQTWAADKVSSSLGLGIFLFDHGGTNSFCIPGPNLHDATLDAFLDVLEADTGMTRSLIVYEACHAGTFIDTLSKDTRIIVCSTDDIHNAYITHDRTTALFTEAFWSSISVSYSIGEAFENANANVNAAGYINSQKPWIDDNHDGIGHEVDEWGYLPNEGDGTDVLNLYIKPPSLVSPLPYLDLCPIRQYVKPDARTLPISIMVANNDTTLKYVKAVITPPGWKPPEPTINSSDAYDPEIYYFPEDTYSDSFFDVFFTINEETAGSYNFTALVNLDGLKKYFGESEGDYRITFMAKTESNRVAQMVPSFITINEDGEAPTDLTPPTVTITNPINNLNINETINITVKGDDDQALDKIQILLDGELLDESNMPSYYPYPEAVYSLDTSKHVNGLHNITAIAIDESGNQKQTSVFVTFENSLILNFDYIPYLIGAGIGIAVSLVGSLIFRRKKK